MRARVCWRPCRSTPTRSRSRAIPSCSRTSRPAFSTRRSSWTAGWSVSVSASGSLGYYSAPSTNTIATWYDANGVPSGTLNLPQGHYESITISPDGTRGVAVLSTSPVRIDAVARRSGARWRDTALLGARAQRHAGVVTRRHSRGLGCRSRRGAEPVREERGRGRAGAAALSIRCAVQESRRLVARRAMDRDDAPRPGHVAERVAARRVGQQATDGHRAWRGAR